MRCLPSKLVLLPLVALSLVVVGCERSDLPGSPSDPRFAPVARQSLHRVPAKAGTPAADLASALIGPEGGLVELAGHRLTVPAGAVARPTRFTMRLLETGYVEVDLRAGQASARGTEIDVGKQGFARPVTLSLSYSDADVRGDLTSLVIAWIKPDGTLQALRSVIDSEGRAVIAELDHFSSYVLATM